MCRVGREPAAVSTRSETSLARNSSARGVGVVRHEGIKLIGSLGPRVRRAAANRAQDSERLDLSVCRFRSSVCDVGQDRKCRLGVEDVNLASMEPGRGARSSAESVS